jgi:hypothetical protein
MDTNVSEEIAASIFRVEEMNQELHCLHCFKLSQSAILSLV